MSYSSLERNKRRPIIIRGINQGLRNSVIAKQLGVNKRIILNDLQLMRYNKDPELEKALKSQAKIARAKQSLATINNDKFFDMTGMSFQEKSFRNMIDYNRNELLKIISSKNQHSAIMKLPKSIRKSLVNNGIIISGWKNSEISSKTIDYLFKSQ
jgi:hypothetical protein